MRSSRRREGRRGRGGPARADPARSATFADADDARGSPGPGRRSRRCVADHRRDPGISGVGEGTGALGRGAIYEQAGDTAGSDDLLRRGGGLPGAEGARQTADGQGPDPDGVRPRDFVDFDLEANPAVVRSSASRCSGTASRIWVTSRRPSAQRRPCPPRVATRPCRRSWPTWPAAVTSLAMDPPHRSSLPTHAERLCHARVRHPRGPGRN